MNIRQFTVLLVALLLVFCPVCFSLKVFEKCDNTQPLNKFREIKMIPNRIIKLHTHKPYLLVARNASTTQETKSIQPPNPKRISTDMVGPPDPVSNLRKVIFRIPPNETELERKYREMRSEVQEWNQKFWEKHNSQFYQEREAYVKNNIPADKQNLTADEMSVFYKSFLDKNWKLHLNYNKEWYKKNFALLGLAVKVKVKKLLRLKD